MSTGVGKVPILAIKVLNPLPLLSSHQEVILANMNVFVMRPRAACHCETSNVLEPH